MLVLLFADSRNTSTLGPVAAIGVACSLLAGLTLLPALLTIFGRRGFWPRRRTVEYDPEHAADVKAGRLAALRRQGPAPAGSGARGHRSRSSSPARSG